ncbi:MAG: NAD(P)-dependent oxidoreductase [Nanoarchaeota archaeon]
MQPIKKRIFITGGAGYVGSALAPSLLENGYEVVVYDLYIYGDVLKKHPCLIEIKGDIRDRKKLVESTKGCDAVIHLACISNDPSFDLNPELSKSINFHAFQNVVDAVRLNKVDRFIVASSTSQYGVKPLDIEVTEDVEAEPITDYARHKIECEKLLLETNAGDADYVFVRPATLAGYAPRLRLDLSVNLLTIQALATKKIKIFGGNQMRPTLNIKDMVRLYEFLLEAPDGKISKQAFNAAYANYTIKQLAEMVKKVIGDDSIEFEFTASNDQRSYHVSSKKIRNFLGFECIYAIDEAIQTLVDAYNKGLIVDGLNNPLYYNIKRMKEIRLK